MAGRKRAVWEVLLAFVQFTPSPSSSFFIGIFFQNAEEAREKDG